MKHSEAVNTTRTYMTCDLCQKRMRGNRTCPGCKRDVCESCGVWWEQDPFWQTDNGDYPPLVCKECDHIAMKYKNAAVGVNQHYESEINGLEESWRAECKAKEDTDA